MRLMPQQPRPTFQMAVGDVPAGQHAVQFFDTDDFLLEALQRYIQRGLEAGDACVVIATRQHRKQLETSLRAAGRDLLALRRDGQYLSLDADRLLATFMVDAALDAERFTRTSERLMQRATRSGRPVRVFGEMVAQLWLAGNKAAAIRLEMFWNEIHQHASSNFTLLCAYPMRLFDADAEPPHTFAAVCQQHQRVMPDETTPILTDPAERIQAFARLQQETHTLRVEIAQRQFAEARLHVSEERYRRLFEMALDGVLMFDPHTGRIQAVNPAAMQLFERDAERLLGQEVWCVGLFNGPQVVNGVIRALRRQPMLRYEALSLRTASGVERLVEFVSSLIALEDGSEVVQCTIRDVTERQRMANELVERTHELETLQTITDIALAQPSLDKLLHELMERTGTILGVDNVAILLPDATGRELYLHLAHGPEQEVAGQVRVPIGQGVAGSIAATRQPLVIDDLSAVTVANPFLHERLSSLMGVPLLVEDRLIGVMHASTIAPHHFTARELRLLQLVAERIALAIERARLHQATQQARQEAAEQAGQLRTIIEAIADGIVVFDRDGSLLQMNAAARHLLGYSASPAYTTDRVGFNDHRVRDSHGRELSSEEWPVSRVLRGEVIQGAQALDLMIQTTEGRDVELSVSGAPMRDAENTVQGAVCVFRDVTAQRHLERRTHAALAAVLAMANALVDLPATDQPTAAEAPADATASATASAATPAMSPVTRRLAQLVRDVLDCQRVGVIAIEPVTQLLRPVAVVGLEPEIERIWWQSQLERPQRYGADGTDPALLEQFARGKAQVIDVTQPPYDKAPNPYGLSTTLVSPMRIGSELIGLLAADFGTAPHSFSDEEQRLAEAVAQLVALVIERERILTEREQARASALAAQHTASRLHTFLGIAGHELRTPVTSIKVGVQMSERALDTLLHDALPADAARPLQRALTLLAHANEQANRLSRLIDDILDVIRTQSDRLDLHAKPDDLVAVVRQAVESQRLAWPDREITLTAPAHPVILPIDADRIEQVVANYLTNALKYSERHQPVAVEVAVHAGVARVAVRDRGPGMSPEMQRRVWEPFHQVDGIEQQSGVGLGLGLGLYICCTLIERHGGRFGVESAVGKGSTFWFELLPEGAPPDRAAMS